MCFVRRPGAGVSAYLPHSLQAKHETNIASGIVSRGPARQATGATSGRFVIARGVGPAIDVDDPFFENYWRRLGPGSWVLGRNRFFALGTYRTVFTDKSSVQVLKISVFFLFTIWKLLFKKQQLEGEERGQQPPASIIMASSDCPPATAKLFELDAARRAKRDEVLLSRIENGACSSSALPLDVRALTGEP